MLSWRFREMQDDEINQDPVQNEFFAPEEGYTAALVRETVQNSLDAALGGEPVVVRFTFGATAVPWEELYLFEGLKPHLIAQDTPWRPEWHERVPLLLIEDFNTRGLGGDPRQVDINPDEEDGEKNDFFYFWRNIGRSEKKASERGRWGLGKTVFSGTSRVQSFFGLTTRAADRKSLLMGQSIGRIHSIQGRKYAYYGYNADHSSRFPLPVSDAAELDRFRSVTGLTRAVDGSEPGLSICIPFPEQEVTAQEILQSVIASYFLPVLRNQLVVEVRDSANEFLLNAATIQQVIESHGGMAREQLDALTAFAARVCRLPDEAHRTLLRVGESGAPDWAAALEGIDVDGLRSTVEAGEILAFHVPVVVHRKNGVREQDAFRLYLQRDDSLASGSGDFIRQGLAISQVNRPPKGSYRGLVIVEDGALATLLGDSENPAHTQWKERSDRVRNNYERGASTVRFVVNSLRQLSTMLNRPVEGIERDLLRDLFYIEVPPPPEPEPGEGQGEEDDVPIIEPPDMPPVVSRPVAFRINRVDRGFRVSHVPAVPPPDSVTIEAGYAVRRGNPFRRYHPADFQFGSAPLEINVSNAAYTAENNRIVLTDLQPEFEVQVVGFDPHRDLIVRALVGGSR